MSHWKRITLVAFVLIGGTMSFGYWFLSQFNQALDDFSVAYLANTMTVPSSFKKDAHLTPTSSLEISEALSTSTDETIPGATSTTSTATTTPVTATSIDLEPSFTFPQKGVYVGCTYPISWQSATTINLLGAILVNASTKDSWLSTTSGLAKESKIEVGSQNLPWKVGSVPPGGYYIKVSKINGVDVAVRSKVFTISNLPKGTTTDEREKICKGSGGVL